MKSETTVGWKAAAKQWAEQENGRHFCACGCGQSIRVSWIHYHRGIPETIRGHFKRMRKSEAQLWIEANQGKHVCQCGCGEVIQIQIQHHVRGIPKFKRFHASKIIKPGLGRFGSANGRYKGGRYVNHKGYVLRLIPPQDRKSPTNRYACEHRIVVEQKLGRKLSRDEVVHHKNRQKSDNRQENLDVESNANHTSIHARAGEVGFGLLKKLGRKWWEKKQ